MSEQTTPSDTLHPDQGTAPEGGGACCSAIAELRLRAERAAALRAQEAAPGGDGNAPTLAPSGGA
ncbi:hypothetical protein OHT59_04570 [Streptomyces sp. NBC_00243]|uniref:hypothetical protein n=1 Tax=Streptomyces sp. NBC_00243 TaxID=2975688 RepID=UPI002DD8E3B1|nr:hypothetical protein [Streptomyces sp. NBC_00243]WRZ17810.1 hypothetical protein OHT59_04570 [Streptomyces sp. NBC_00243]